MPSRIFSRNDEGGSDTDRRSKLTRREIVAWVGSNIVPHEADLRARLRRMAVPEQEISDIVQDAYALSHSNLFHAAVIGTGVTTDPTSFYLTAPEPESVRRQTFEEAGLPPPEKDKVGAWATISAALNAERIRAPLLLLPPENEYLFGLQLYTSIRDAGGIARMIIYPGEGHLVSRQPRHLMERESNSVDWLDCWLKRSGSVPNSDKIATATAAQFTCPTSNTEGHS